MQRPLGRFAIFAVPVLTALAAAEEPIELYPCPAVVRLGKMDESGTVTRPRTPREYAANMKRYCDYAVLGRFVSITDRRYDTLYGPADEPIASTFQVSEVLHGAAVATVKVHFEHAFLVAPDEEVSRRLSRLESMMDGIYRRELADETERELEAIRESGKPLTADQHERLVDALRRLVEVPPRTTNEMHELADSAVWSTSPLDFYSELGAIRPDEMYLLGLSDDNKEPPIGGHFNPLHSYLFWGQEALDIAAALREKQE